METASFTPRIRAADIFNSAVASSAIAAAWEVGALDELAAEGYVEVGDFADRHGLDHEATIGMFQALASVRIVRREDDTVFTDDNFADVARARSFHHWLSRGCAELFADMSSILHTENRVGRFFKRDSAAIAVACREINERFFDPIFWEAIEPLAFTKVADLGCGSAERLIRILKRNPHAEGLGIDIADGALRVAQGAVDEARVTDRVSFVKADVTTLAPQGQFTDVDLLTCFLMGHDLWPRDSCVESLRQLRVAFPNVRRLMLGDTARTTTLSDQDTPVFTLGFEVAHRMMGVYLPTLDEWNSVLADSGWRLVGEHKVPIPADSVIFELVPET